MKKLEYTLNATGTFIKVYINSSLHLSIKQEDFVGLQSYIDGINIYCIKIYMKNIDPIVCEYDKIEKWKEILTLLNQII